MYKAVKTTACILALLLLLAGCSLFDSSTPADEPEEEGDFDIVRTKRFSLKPMTPEEAILQMNLLEHEFFVFLNMDDNDSFSVVYKRNQGGYGLISAADV